MRRSFVQARRVRIQGSLPVGNIPHWRRPMMSVSWLFGRRDVGVSMPLIARQPHRIGRSLRFGLRSSSLAERPFDPFWRITGIEYPHGCWPCADQWSKDCMEISRRRPGDSAQMPADGSATPVRLQFPRGPKASSNRSAAWGRKGLVVGECFDEIAAYLGQVNHFPAHFFRAATWARNCSRERAMFGFAS